MTYGLSLTDLGAPIQGNKFSRYIYCVKRKEKQISTNMDILNHLNILSSNHQTSQLIHTCFPSIHKHPQLDLEMPNQPTSGEGGVSLRKFNES